MLHKLARMLGVRIDQVEDALADEQRCKKQLTRRGLLAAGAALVGGSLLPAKTYSFGSPYPYAGVDWTTVGWSALIWYAAADAHATSAYYEHVRQSIYRSVLLSDAQLEAIVMQER